tara:strand:- start:233 stop:547 length:315 start_codon:yes stop_codon:yes gene_type:complete
MDNFNLKKFLVENKLTANSRIISERDASRLGTDYEFIKSPEEDPSVAKVLEYLKQNYQEGVDFEYDSNMQRLDIYDDVKDLSSDETLVDLLSDVFEQPDYEDGY